MSIASLSTIAALGVAVSQARLDASSARPVHKGETASAPHAPAARAGPSPALRQAEQLGAQLEAELAYQRMALYQFQSNLRAMRNGDKPPGQLLDVSA